MSTNIFCLSARNRKRKNYKRLGCVQPKSCSVWHTGLCGGAPDSVRCARLASSEQATLGKNRRRTAIIHRTVRWCTGLSGEPTVASANGQPRDLRATHRPQQWSAGHTGLSGVHRTVSGVHRTVSGAPTDPEDQRSDASEKEGDRAPDSYSDCPVHHPTEGKFGLPSWPPTAPSCLGAIKGTPRCMEELPKHSLSILRLQDSNFTHLILCVSVLSSI